MQHVAGGRPCTPCRRRRSVSAPGRPRRRSAISTASDSRITGPKISRPACAQRGAGRDDVGDGIRHAEPHGRLDGAVERARGRGDAVAGEEVVDEARVARWRRARPRGRRARQKRPAGPAKRNVESPKPSGAISARVGAGVEQQVAAGDADVERARADVGGDVARAEVEELDLVARVDDVQVARVAAAGVAGLVQHLGGGLGERALVGHGDSQHARGFRCRRSGSVMGMACSEMSVDVGGREPLREHEHLQVVEQLRDLLGASRRRLCTRRPSRPRRPPRRSSCRSRARRRRARARCRNPLGGCGLCR